MVTHPKNLKIFSLSGLGFGILATVYMSLLMYCDAERAQLAELTNSRCNEDVSDGLYPLASVGLFFLLGVASLVYVKRKSHSDLKAINTKKEFPYYSAVAGTMISFVVSFLSGVEANLCMGQDFAGKYGSMNGCEGLGIDFNNTSKACAIKFEHCPAGVEEWAQGFGTRFQRSFMYSSLYQLATLAAVCSVLASIVVYCGRKTNAAHQPVHGQSEVPSQAASDLFGVRALEIDDSRPRIIPEEKKSTATRDLTAPLLASQEEPPVTLGTPRHFPPAEEQKPSEPTKIFLEIDASAASASNLPQHNNQLEDVSTQEEINPSSPYTTMPTF